MDKHRHSVPCYSCGVTLDRPRWIDRASCFNCKKNHVKKNAAFYKERHKNMYTCIESTIEFSPVPNRTIRLWINQDAIKDDYVSEKAITALLSFYFEQKEKPTNAALVEFAKREIQNLNAIQIKETVGNADYGVVVYLVDF